MIRERDNGLIEFYASCERCNRSRWITQNETICYSCKKVRREIAAFFEIVTRWLGLVALVLLGACFGAMAHATTVLSLGVLAAAVFVLAMVLTCAFVILRS